MHQMIINDLKPRQLTHPVSLLLLNGAEPATPMDVGEIGGLWGPDFSELGRQFLGHPKVSECKNRWRMVGMLCRQDSL